MENLMDIAGRILSRTKSLDKAISHSKMMAYTSHCSWDYRKYNKIVLILEEMKKIK
jgi:hypothetical protein